MLRIFKFIITTSLSLILVLFITGCIEPVQPETVKVIPPAITLMISSNTVSNFTPCGCSSGKWGGMPRRGTIFNNADLDVDWPFLQIDTGDITQGSTGEIQQVKDDYIFQAYQVMDYDVVNVGLNELRLGIEKLKSIGDEFNISWISSNTYSPGIYPDLPIPNYNNPSNPQNGAISPDNPGDNPGADENDQVAPLATDALPLFKPYLIVEPPEAPGYKIGFIGAMIQDAGRLNPLRNDFSFEPYAEAIQRNVEILRNEEKVDLVILLSDADNFSADVQADEVFAGIDIVIGSKNVLQRSDNALFNPLNPFFNETMALNYMDESGQTGVDESNQDTSEGEETDPFANIELQPLTTPLMVPKAESRGRLVMRLDIFLDASGRIIDYWFEKPRVDDTNIDDPRMAEITRGYLEDVLAREMNARVERRFAGSQACEACHPGYLEAWSDFGHFNSYETIINDENGQASSCTGCHASGYFDEPMLLTYDLVPEELLNVGCEGCHQNGKQHITLKNHIASLSPENRDSVTTTDVMSQGITINSCQKCHTFEWSPEFNFEASIEAARGICTTVR